jgi:hypothetical protein
MAILLALALTIAHATPAAAQEEPTKEELRAGLRRVEQTRYVRGGKQLNLGSLTPISPNCTVLESDNTITKEPEHGTATIDVSEHFPNFSKDNVRAKCNDKKVRGPVLLYKAATGYVGTDTLEVLSIGSSGFATEYVLTIKIIEGKKR